MVTKTQVPAAVEGSQLLITGQKIKPNGRPNQLSDTGEIVYPLKVSIRGEAIIERENDPKQYRFKEYSLLEFGDKISGQNLWGFGSDPLGSNDIRVGGSGRTSSHKGQELTITGTCFVELIEGWIGLPTTIHPQQELLQVT